MHAVKVLVNLPVGRRIGDILRGLPGDVRFQTSGRSEHQALALP